MTEDHMHDSIYMTCPEKANVQKEKVDSRAGAEHRDITKGMQDLSEVVEYVLKWDGGNMSEFYGM